MNHLLVTVLLAAVAGGCLFPMSRADVQAAERRHVERMCNDPNYAYESGYNAGLDRKRLDTRWADTDCAPAYRDNTRSAYQSGYNQGIANAPVVVPVRGGSIAVAERCTFSSDCGDGRTCRQNQCMGQGYAGEACWFSSDCLSGSCDVAQKTCK